MGELSRMPIEDKGKLEDPTTFARFLRNHSTTAEKILWRHLKDSKAGYKFRRQFEFDERTFCDLCCTSVKVIVEVDGDVHDDQVEEDASRQKRLEDAGFLVLRFSNDVVMNWPERVVAEIIHACDGRNQRRY